jgi:hypothetical protein
MGFAGEIADRGAPVVGVDYREPRQSQADAVRGDHGGWMRLGSVMSAFDCAVSDEFRQSVGNDQQLTARLQVSLDYTGCASAERV